MNCTWTTARLSAYVDNELGGEDMLRIREHLRLCPCCAQELEALRTIKLSLAELSTCGPDPDFESRLIAHVMGADLSPARRSPNRLALVAAAGLAIAGLSYVVIQQVAPPKAAPAPQLVEADPAAVWGADPLSGQVPVVSAASYNR
ncbi:MAG: zf-HC2 domain-containing protein [Chthonomonas sp.]|nr:zf-HC2 domain-containing protein [Chthonomonas sp.]